MKERTDEEITEKLGQIWPEAELGYSKGQFKIERTAKHIDLTIANMYESPGLSFDKIQALAEFFDTMNVETENEFAYSGCESCDYGSEYGFILRVRPGDAYTELDK